MMMLSKGEDFYFLSWPRYLQYSDLYTLLKQKKLSIDLECVKRELWSKRQEMKHAPRGMSPILKIKKNLYKDIIFPHGVHTGVERANN